MKQRTHMPLYGLLTVFVLPILFAVYLYTHNYTGITTNKGHWINPPITLTDIVKRPNKHAKYHWQIIYSPSIERTHNVNSIIQILGIKSELVSPLPVSSLMLTKKGKAVIDRHHFYLADPQQKIILSYHEEQALDIAKDLKKLLKPIEKR